MISEMAIEDLEQMKKDGLEPTYDDIIRLNELALVYEQYKKKHILNDMYVRPRIAQIGESKWFRQPTIGHEIWIDSVREWIASDYDSILAMYAFALSRDFKELPAANDITKVTEAIRAFTVEMQDYMQFQISEAVSYVLNGCEPKTGVYPSYKVDDDDDYEKKLQMCVALGVLNEGKAVLWGLSEYDMKCMTRRQLEDVIKRSYLFHDMKTNDNADTKLNEYYRTLDSIRDRISKEKEKIG